MTARRSGGSIQPHADLARLRTRNRHLALAGLGVGAGKLVVNLHFSLGELLGTNAAHCEYLRIPTEGGFIGATLLVALLVLWVRRGSAKLQRDQRIVIRLVFFAFAVQSMTVNTLIATTSLAFFTWARAVLVFADESVS
jgi:hypothetical protein